ncbi:hypothetical protein [Mycetohabitans endofungorum]|uniref:hypothetical protein n=1 Tax=Mycetohabitans endofungorum TaxID=417203 RepID=UPI002B05E740|nr:hypothetical protein [Mycetohabitans endofungorum]
MLKVIDALVEVDSASNTAKGEQLEILLTLVGDWSPALYAEIVKTSIFYPMILMWRNIGFSRLAGIKLRIEKPL